MIAKNNRASELESKRASDEESRSAKEFGAKGKIAQEPRSKRARRTEVCIIREQESKEHHNLDIETMGSRGREVERRKTETCRARCR